MLIIKLDCLIFLKMACKQSCMPHDEQLDFLKEHVALGRTSWYIKVDYNHPHKFASKLRGFPFALLNNTVGHLWDTKI